MSSQALNPKISSSNCDMKKEGDSMRLRYSTAVITVCFSHPALAAELNACEFIHPFMAIISWLLCVIIFLAIVGNTLKTENVIYRIFYFVAGVIAGHILWLFVSSFLVCD
ncbi:TPA: hypothetical protein QHK25_004958 [Klebsiella quasipneumoniae subsp. similipneumoniae]|nr:hypothetical protein [Klebsiella quasipneumoniae subsp. similipneumoniae]